MNIAILDDSKEDLRQVKSVISSYYESQNTSADIHLYSSAEAFFTKYIPGFYDLIIMDIYMGSMTGMDAARKLREARDTAALIFISSSDSFAVESYDVQASYYLLKPFDPEKLCRILSTIQFRQSQKFEELLEGMKCFLSCYRGCIVNMDHIEKSTDEGFVMDNQELVTVRKRGSNAIKKAYLEYLFSSDSDK